MRRSLIICDDFLNNAAELREAALKLEYSPNQGNFPGRNSEQRMVLDGLDRAVSQIVGEHLEPVQPPESHAKFRVTMEKDEGRADIHVDASHWSGILFLSRDLDCRGGTDFFRHLSTNSDRMPIDDGELAGMGFSSYEEMHREIIEKDGKDRSKWELQMRIPMQFNRLILLRPWFWHTAGPGFGSTMEDARLVYLMFFRQKARPTGA